MTDPVARDAVEVLYALSGVDEWLRDQYYASAQYRPGPSQILVDVGAVVAEAMRRWGHKPWCEGYAFGPLTQRSRTMTAHRHFGIVLAVATRRERLVLGFGRSRCGLKDGPVSPGSAWPILRPWTPNRSAESVDRKLLAWANAAALPAGNYGDRRELTFGLARALVRRHDPALWEGDR